jgi:hypothetical protein
VTYKVYWDNGHACDTFPYEFTSKRKAETWAREWKREMVALEPTKRERTEARAAYQWEVIEVEPVEANDGEGELIREAWER